MRAQVYAGDLVVAEKMQQAALSAVLSAGNRFNWQLFHLLGQLGVIKLPWAGNSDWIKQVYVGVRVRMWVCVWVYVVGDVTSRRLCGCLARAITRLASPERGETTLFALVGFSSRHLRGARLLVLL